MLPRILVGCPTHSSKKYCLGRYVERVKQLDYPNYDVVLADNSKDAGKYKRLIENYGLKCLKGAWVPSSEQRIAESRNILRDYALCNGYDHYFNLEQDVIPAPSVLRTLVAHRKEVVGGWYYLELDINVKNGVPSRIPCVFMQGFWRPRKSSPRKPSQPIEMELLRERLLKVAIGSMGVCLISRRVLQGIAFECDAAAHKHDDIFFYHALEKSGIDAFVDTDLLVNHFSVKDRCH